MDHYMIPASTSSPNTAGPSPATQPVTAQRRYPAAPLVGVAAAVIDTQGRVLLVKRGRPPRAGSWGLPGGLLDLGERLTDGASREVQEETGVEIEVKDVVGTFEPIQLDEQGRIEYHYVVIDFWARHIRGEPRAQDDADAVAWVSQQHLDHYHLSADTRRVVESALAAWEADPNTL
jgi:8-oxo-dGTP diphosphatase